MCFQLWRRGVVQIDDDDEVARVSPEKDELLEAEAPGTFPTTVTIGSDHHYHHHHQQQN